MHTALTTLHTPRLRLLPPDTTPGTWQVAAVADFYRRNTAHFAPWDPPLPPDHAAPAQVAQALADGADAFANGRAWRWWLEPLDHPGRVIGQVHLSGVARGPFQSCNLGYALDAGCQGRGLMHEALQQVVADAFSPRLNLHRIQAGVRPENHRSRAVLARLGFAEIGLARHHLFIDGAWRDHLLVERINPDFVPPAAW